MKKKIIKLSKSNLGIMRVVTIVLVVFGISQVLQIMLSDIMLIKDRRTKDKVVEKPRVIGRYFDDDVRRFIFPCQFSLCGPKEQDEWRRDIYETVWEPSLWFDDENVVRLCVALYKDTPEEAEDIIVNKGVDLNYCGKDGMRILFWSMFCEFDQIELLLKHGAEVDFAVNSTYLLADYPRDEFGPKSFLGILAHLSYFEDENASSHRFYELFKLILKYGADPNYEENPDRIVRHGRSDKTHELNAISQAILASGYDVQGGRYNGSPYFPKIPKGDNFPASREEVGLAPYLMKSGYLCDLNSEICLSYKQYVAESIYSGVPPDLLKSLNIELEHLQSDPDNPASKRRQKELTSYIEFSKIYANEYMQILSSQGVVFDKAQLNQ